MLLQNIGFLILIYVTLITISLTSMSKITQFIAMYGRCLELYIVVRPRQWLVQNLAMQYADKSVVQLVLTNLYNKNVDLTFSSLNFFVNMISYVLQILLVGMPYVLWWNVAHSIKFSSSFLALVVTIVASLILQFFVVKSLVGILRFVFCYAFYFLQEKKVDVQVHQVELRKPRANIWNYFVLQINVALFSFVMPFGSYCLYAQPGFFDYLLGLASGAWLIIFEIFFCYPFVSILCGVGFIICLLLVVAYYTLFERKVMGSVQRRTGPRFVGFWGILQPLADGLKLLLKEVILVQQTNVLLFILAPMFAFIIAISLWSLVPFFYGVIGADFSLGLIAIFAFSSLNIYGVLLGGWASRSQYSLIGALRGASQIISYELSLGLLFLVVRVGSGTFNLQEIVASQAVLGWNIVTLAPFFFIFLIIMLAETNRAPYDLAEAEAELVAGFHTEYSAILFALFFLAEYANMFLFSLLGVLLFLGGWLPFNSILAMSNFVPIFEFFYFKDSSLILKIFGASQALVPNPINFSSLCYLIIKTQIVAFFFVLVRAALPRYRFDQLLTIGWKRLLPLTFGLFIFYLGLNISVSGA